MRVPLGREGWYLCRWFDPAEKGDLEFRGDQAAAFRFLSRVSAEPFAIGRLRMQLERAPAKPSTDTELLQDLSWGLSCGLWKVRQRPRPMQTGSGSSESQATSQKSAPFPLAAKPSTAPQSSSSPAPEAAVFPNDVDAAAIAKGLKSAAAQGVPFCEECLAAAAAGRG